MALNCALFYLICVVVDKLRRWRYAELHITLNLAMAGVVVKVCEQFPAAIGIVLLCVAIMLAMFRAIQHCERTSL